jgi:hypothetical protein
MLLWQVVISDICNSDASFIYIYIHIYIYNFFYPVTLIHIAYLKGSAET